MSTFCCWPCNKGTLLTAVTLDFGAYVPGQNINYTIRMQNQSMSDVLSYTVQFVQWFQFVATMPSYKELNTKHVLLEQQERKRSLRLTNRIFEGVLQVPSIPPTTFLEHIPNIRLGYFLKFIFKIFVCHRSVHLKVPIFIGTVPLQESLTQSNGNLATAPVLANLAVDLPPSYIDLSKFEKNY